MNNPLLAIVRRGVITQREIFPDLPEEADGLPAITTAPCAGDACSRCVDVCPVGAIRVAGAVLTLDRGCCLGCGACREACPTGSIVRDRSTRTAVSRREDLILTNQREPANPPAQPCRNFLRSLHIREVSTGDNACDLEVIAATNAIFDISRFGIQFTASPRFADALLVTGPVGRAMQEPLLRCYEAMAEPRLVIAAGVSAISGGLYRGGYAAANGAASLLPVSSYIPGDPPHPWSIIHGILLAMGRLCPSRTIGGSFEGPGRR